MKHLKALALGGSLLMGAALVAGTAPAWARPGHGGGSGGGNAGGVPAGKVRKSVALVPTSEGEAVGATGSARIESWLRKGREFLRVKVKVSSQLAGKTLEVYVLNPAGAGDPADPTAPPPPAVPVLFGTVTLGADDDSDGSVSAQLQRRTWGGGPQRGFPDGVQPVAGISEINVVLPSEPAGEGEEPAPAQVLLTGVVSAS